MPILPVFLQKIKEEGMLINSLCKASIIPMLKPDKNIVRKENFRPISLINIDGKILNYRQKVPKLQWFNSQFFDYVDAKGIGIQLKPYFSASNFEF